MVLVEYTYSSRSYHNCKDRRAVVKTFVWTVNRPNCFGYEGLLVVIIILLHRFTMFNQTDEEE